VSARRVRAFKHRKPRHQEGRRGSRPLLHIPPMTQLAGYGEHEIAIVDEIDCTIRRGIRYSYPAPIPRGWGIEVPPPRGPGRGS
jgi:hypothetical protein